ncbi:DUF5615 family PIN-like protein [Haloarcula halophila]|uniref:DUF5615 family PIN-like protein n=1 Tax=Haloarcula halophila TaxID=3032584 RepID=UPI0023E35D24|nr:DUF5615 family PIN-like protein [Halomicroarcula sp. DFY41]
MAYRILADENIERATVTYLRKLGHDVEWIRDVSELGVGSSDTAIASYATAGNRLILTQDDDFFTEMDLSQSPGFSSRKTRRSLHAKSATSSTKCLSISIKRMSRWNMSVLTGCKRG